MNTLKIMSKRILVFREPQKEQTRAGIILPENKICKGRVTRILAAAKDCDPDLTIPKRLFTYAYDSFEDLVATEDLEFSFKPEHDYNFNFPEGISLDTSDEEWRIVVKKGTKLTLLSQDMCPCILNEDLYVADQNELGG